ncbi:MAG: ABC transporter permease [Verrucomicrobiota bacterium]|nr:ABC transporter permease [Verrucomicrobiota bacterium]
MPPFQNFLAAFGQYTQLIIDTAYWTFVAPFREKGKVFNGPATAEQLNEVGVRSLFIVLLLMFLVGLVLAMQSANELSKFQTTNLIPPIVCASIMRELGPLVVSIIVVGRSGSAIAAELGSMKIAEEIEALRTMGINPVRVLIVPRFIGMVVMVPILTIFGIVVGCAGGALIAWHTAHIPPDLFLTIALPYMFLVDIAVALLKSTVFGFLIATICCYFGFTVEGGAEGVGRATTSSVVMSIIAIIIADLILTAFFFFG